MLQFRPMALAVLACGNVFWMASVDAAQPLPEALDTPPAPAPYADPAAGHFGTPPVMPAIPGYTTRGAGPASGTGPFWAPGGSEGRIGSPYYYHSPYGNHVLPTGNPYFDHFGPGFQRHSLQGHYRFPYYNYRAPWYYPGRAVYNRDTNLAW